MSLIQKLELLLEIKKEILLRNTDAGRMNRSKRQVKTRPVSTILLDEQKRIWMVEFNFKAFPSTEEKRHWGYVLYDMSNDDVKEMFCDCKDWFYRLYAPMVKNKLARWNMNTKYNSRTVKPHNHQWTKITNPEGKLYVCKHMAAMLNDYIGSDSTEPPPPPPKAEIPKKPEEAPPEKKPLSGIRLNKKVSGGKPIKKPTEEPETETP